MFLIIVKNNDYVRCTHVIDLLSLYHAIFYFYDFAIFVVILET